MKTNASSPSRRAPSPGAAKAARLFTFPEPFHLLTSVQHNALGGRSPPAKPSNWSVRDLQESLGWRAGKTVGVNVLFAHANWRLSFAASIETTGLCRLIKRGFRAREAALSFARQLATCTVSVQVGPGDQRLSELCSVVRFRQDADPACEAKSAPSRRRVELLSLEEKETVCNVVWMGLAYQTQKRDCPDSPGSARTREASSIAANLGASGLVGLRKVAPSLDKCLQAYRSQRINAMSFADIVREAPLPGLARIHAVPRPGEDRAQFARQFLKSWC